MDEMTRSLKEKFRLQENEINSFEFDSKTPCIQQGTIGNVLLINTPGLNDSEGRLDSETFVGMIKGLNSNLNDPDKGISSFI